MYAAPGNNIYLILLLTYLIVYNLCACELLVNEKIRI